MARKRYNDEDVLSCCERWKSIQNGVMSVQDAWRHVGLSDKTYYAWRKRFDGPSPRWQIGPNQVKLALLLTPDLKTVKEDVPHTWDPHQHYL